MTPSRSEPQYANKSRQTVPSSGCLSGFILPPLVALIFGVILAVATIRLNGNDSQPAHAAPANSAAANTVSGQIAPLFTPEVQFWAASIIRWASEHGVDPNLAATVMQIESCGNPSARSRSGAAGLFQVMPFHFLAYEDNYDPDTNALRGLDYLRRSLERASGDARLALAGYNGGIGVIGRFESAWAAETQRYAYWGSGIYVDAVNNASESARLNEWLAAGGSGLCQKAHQRLGLP